MCVHFLFSYIYLVRFCNFNYLTYFIFLFTTKPYYFQLVLMTNIQIFILCLNILYWHSPKIKALLTFGKWFANAHEVWLTNNEHRRNKIKKTRRLEIHEKTEQVCQTFGTVFCMCSLELAVLHQQSLLIPFTFHNFAPQEFSIEVRDIEKCYYKHFNPWIFLSFKKSNSCILVCLLLGK